MSKRLVLVFCALFMLAMAVPAFAAVQNIKVSGDILARNVSRNNFDLNDGDGTDSEDQIDAVNSVVRLRVDADLTDNVQTVLRLINERNWTDAGSTDSDIDLDLAYVTLKEFLYSPLTLAIGRQELHFGNDMIIGDGVGAPMAALVSGGVGTNQTTNYTEAVGYGSINGDLAARKAFDAVRATLNYDPFVIDVIAAKIDEGVATGASSSDDVDLYGMNAGYKFSDKWNSMAEGYFWGKLSNNNGRPDKVYTIGGRVSTNPTEKLNLQQEIAVQTGRKFISGSVLRDRNAWASQTIATLTPGWKHNPVLGLAYSYFSGDANIVGTDPDKTYHAWDPMFENQTAGSIINALFAQSNVHNIDLSVKITPSFLEDVSLKADWVYVALAKKQAASASLTNDYDSAQTYVANKKPLGQELDLTVTYDYTEDVQFGLLTGWYFPGKALAKSAAQSREMAAEAIVSCKVGF